MIMEFTIPLPLQHEHEALHERLRQAARSRAPAPA
jgi:hypothetical protein